MDTDLQIKSHTRVSEPSPHIANSPGKGERKAESVNEPVPVSTAGIDPNVLRKQMQENIKVTVERLNEQMRESSRGLNFSVDEQSNQTIITVKNASTGEVIRQIPDEHLLKAAHSIEALRGLLHDGTY